MAGRGRRRRTVSVACFPFLFALWLAVFFLMSQIIRIIRITGISSVIMMLRSATIFIIAVIRFVASARCFMSLASTPVLALDAVDAGDDGTSGCIRIAICSFACSCACFFTRAGCNGGAITARRSMTRGMGSGLGWGAG